MEPVEIPYDPHIVIKITACSIIIVSNYTPISSLTAFSKILEKIMYKRVRLFLNFNSILADEQIGFRKKPSTEKAIFSFTE
jgi:hypothetical protein